MKSFHYPVVMLSLFVGTAVAQAMDPCFEECHTTTMEPNETEQYTQEYLNGYFHGCLDGCEIE